MIRLSNLFTALLKEIVNSAKNQYLRKLVVCTHSCKAPFLRYGYFSADCLAEICFKIFKSFSYYSFFNKLN